MFNEKAIEYLKEDVLRKEVPLIEILRTAVHGPLRIRETKQLFEFYNIPILCDEWTLEDLRRIQAVLTEEHVSDDFKQFSQLLAIAIDLGNAFGEDHPFSLQDFAEVLKECKIEYSEITRDFIEGFAGNAGFNAMDFLQVFEEVESKSAEDKFSNEQEEKEIELVREALISHVRKELLKIVFPKEQE